ncbi:MAG: hypothetical protein IJE45_06275 [Bacilli bacterium]|nr:hypothetical protein [Bacilli bacterium]
MDDCKSNGFIIWTYEKTIRKHINNIFVDKELEYFNNTQKMRVVGVKLLHELYPGVLEKRYGVSEEYIDDYECDEKSNVQKMHIGNSTS